MPNQDKPKFGSSIPELNNIITRYGSTLGKAPYVIVGNYYSKEIGPFGGILATAQNEFYANLLLREVLKNGTAVIHRTENHTNPTFSVAGYKQYIKEKMEAQKLTEEQAELTEKVATKPFILTLVK
jgi:hypothetical protein